MFCSLVSVEQRKLLTQGVGGLFAEIAILSLTAAVDRSGHLV